MPLPIVPAPMTTMFFMGADLILSEDSCIVAPDEGAA
jgi:hypothetical protein